MTDRLASSAIPDQPRSISCRLYNWPSTLDLSVNHATFRFPDVTLWIDVRPTRQFPMAKANARGKRTPPSPGSLGVRPSVFYLLEDKNPGLGAAREPQEPAAARHLCESLDAALPEPLLPLP